MKKPTYPTDDPRHPDYVTVTERLTAAAVIENPYVTVADIDNSKCVKDERTGEFVMTIGDIKATAKGTGARANGGKVRLDLIPLRLLASTLVYPGMEGPGACATNALSNLGLFQETHKAEQLFSAISFLQDPNDPFAHWRECADVLDYGRKKYAEWNWLKGMPWSVCVGCAARHLLDVVTADNMTAPDHESGLSLRGHIMCNLLFLLQYTDSYREGNDLPPLEYFK